MTPKEIFEAINSFDSEAIDFGFITKTITVAFDIDNKDIEVAHGDFRNYYNNYDYVILLSDGDTEDSLQYEIDRIKMIIELHL